MRKSCFYVPFLLYLVISGCASTAQYSENDCSDASASRASCAPAGAIQDSFIDTLHRERTFGFNKEVPVDLIEFARDTKIPVNDASVKFVPSTDEGALNALAARIWMIENAKHTVDLVYYIFRDDLAGKAILGALCNAVARGVDVRLMVDSLGSLSLDKKNLKALDSCERDAGYMRNQSGELTTQKARVQTVIFNAISKSPLTFNRRSHDKLLLIDGLFPGKTAAITGGRNISLDYFGITENGLQNTHSYRDADLLVKDALGPDSSQYALGRIVETYYSILFLYKNNKMLSAGNSEEATDRYAGYRQSYTESLAKLKALPRMSKSMQGSTGYMTNDFHQGSILLGHEIANLINNNVVTRATENLEGSANSIMGIMARGGLTNQKRIRMVSPYLFSARYKDKNGIVVVDEAKQMLEWLERNPESTIEIVTNSVLTSDNPFTQAVIDMDFAPRLLLSKAQRKKWRKRLSKGELNPELVDSEDWKKMVDHPRLRIYETGRLDDVRFGGNYHHSKLHAKYITADSTGYVGTSNFDYRSRLYNNEMGFFFESEELAKELNNNTDYLISLSYRWGSPEWLEMRGKLRQSKGSKSTFTRKQRTLYNILSKTGLVWLF